MLSSTIMMHTPRSSLPLRPARPLIWMYSPLFTHLHTQGLYSMQQCSDYSRTPAAWKAQQGGADGVRWGGWGEGEGSKVGGRTGRGCDEVWIRCSLLLRSDLVVIECQVGACGPEAHVPGLAFLATGANTPQHLEPTLCSYWPLLISLHVNACQQLTCRSSCRGQQRHNTGSGC